MTDLRIALVSMHVLSAGAFLFAAALPLAAAGAEDRAERLEKMKTPEASWSALGTLLDLWLILEDSIPVFWLFHVIRNAPGDVSAARKRWREESSIRLCFWLATALVVTFPVYFVI